MQQIFRRLAAIASCGAAVAALGASPAQAASVTVTTEPASAVTASTAILHGVVDTKGTSATWQFQYGRTTSYGTGTPVELIAAHGGTVAVSAKITHLRPFTTYHFRLVAVTKNASGHSTAQTTDGSDLTFKTKGTGRLLLDSTKLLVHRGSVSVPFTCASSLTCRGKFSITARARVAGTSRFATIVCTVASKSGYTIGAHKRVTVVRPLHSSCLTLLRKARGHEITAKLTSYPRTGQHAVVSKVVLVRS